MRLVTVLALLLVVGICTTPAMADKDDPVKMEGDPLLPLDVDYFQINLTAGVTVVVETMAGPHCDPDMTDTMLYLYGPNACAPQVAYDDDGGPGLFSLMTYTPTVTGTYYIKMMGYSTNEGCYKFTVKCAGVVPTTLVNELEPNDTCGPAVQTLTCDNYVHGRIGAPPVLGACCVPGCGTCTLTTQATCYAPSVWHGEWTSCTPNQCPVTTPPPVNDTCAGAILLPCGQGLVVNGTLSCATNDYDPGIGTPPPSCTNGYSAVGPDVVYMVSMAVGDVFTAAISAYVTSFDSSIYLVTDCSNVNDSCVAGSDTYPNPPGETITHTATTAGTYYFIVDKYGASAADGFTFTYSLTCPPILGACCDFATGACTITTQTGCPFTWLGAGVPCDPVTCPVPTVEAACCFADGHCELLTEAACLAAPDHIAWLPGVTCSPTANPCPQPGACCNLATGECTFVLEQFCVAPLVFHAELTCVPINPCPPPVPTGACCDPLGNCTVTTQEACLAPNVWHPEWTGCEPNYCPPPVPTEGTTWGQIKANYR